MQEYESWERKTLKHTHTHTHTPLPVSGKAVLFERAWFLEENTWSGETQRRCLSNQPNWLNQSWSQLSPAAQPWPHKSRLVITYAGNQIPWREGKTVQCHVIKYFCSLADRIEVLRLYLSSVQFSRSVVSDSLRAHELQHARPPCPSSTPGVHSNSRPSSRWCHPAISSSVIPFSSCPQSLPASESFPMSQLFAWCGQSTGVSALASVLPKYTQDWSPLEWTGWVSLQSNGLSRVFSNTTVQKHQFFSAQPSSQSNSHIHTWLLEKP